MMVAQPVKCLPAKQTWVRPLDQEDPLEKEMATHSRTLAWKIPWTEEPHRLRSTGSKESNTTEISLSLFTDLKDITLNGKREDAQCYILYDITEVKV